jgi:hypothetical protein
MIRDWQSELANKYPWARGASWSVGDGWRTIVEETFAQIDAIVSAQTDAPIPFAVTDVYEKYASLRIDYTPYRPGDPIEAIVLEAENRSEATCDVCGALGSVRDKGGWLRARCDKHASR